MIGSIHSDQRCPLCGSRFKHQEPKGLFCPQHASQRPTTFKVIFKNITRRFDNYPAAYQVLTRFRAELGGGSFDSRDHKIKTKPLSFENLAAAWLESKKPNVKPKTWAAYRAALDHPRRVWGEANIKDIRYGHIEDLFNGLSGYSSKSKANLMAMLKQFWSWATDRHDIDPMKKWPNIGTVEMAFKKTVSWSVQEEILNDIKQHEHFRVWLYWKWLATYIKIRPGEMLKVKECHLDRGRNLLFIPHPKEKTPKKVELIPEDAAILKSIPLAFDQDAPFFRHEVKKSRGVPGQGFSYNQCYRAWRRACQRLGVDVQPYAGTKHSTAMEARRLTTYEHVRQMTGHKTNPAFERYVREEITLTSQLYQIRGEEIKKAADKQVTTALMKLNNG